MTHFPKSRSLSKFSKRLLGVGEEFFCDFMILEPLCRISILVWGYWQERVSGVSKKSLRGRGERAQALLHINAKAWLSRGSWGKSEACRTVVELLLMTDETMKPTSMQNHHLGCSGEPVFHSGSLSSDTKQWVGFPVFIVLGIWKQVRLH